MNITITVSKYISILFWKCDWLTVKNIINSESEKVCELLYYVMPVTNAICFSKRMIVYK